MNLQIEVATLNLPLAISNKMVDSVFIFARTLNQKEPVAFKIWLDLFVEADNKFQLV